MADEKGLKTILNQRGGPVILPPDAEELKKNRKAPARKVEAGQTITVSEAEAKHLLNHKGLVDASSIAASGPSVADLQAQIAKLSAENEALKKKSPDAAPAAEPEKKGKKGA